MAVFGVCLSVCVCVCVCCVVLVERTLLYLSPSARKGRSWVVERVVSPATLTAQERDELVEQLSKLQISGE